MKDSDNIPEINTKSLLISGFLWSGSGAVVDLLRSSERIGLLPGEFDEFRRPGMVADHLEDIISENYPSNLVPASSAISKLKRLIPLDRRLRIRRVSTPDKIRYAYKMEVAKKIRDESLSSSEKMKFAREWLCSLKHLFAANKEYMLIDQPILWGRHLQIWPEFFNPFKMIVVARDPLDQVAEIIRQNHLFYHFRAPDADIWGGGRNGAFNYILHALLIRIIHYQKIRSVVESGKLLFLKFENLVNETEQTVQEIAEFLDLNFDEIYPSSFFNPSESVKNIGISEQILTRHEASQLEDIVKIYDSNYELEFKVETCFEKQWPQQSLHVVTKK